MRELNRVGSYRQIVCHSSSRLMMEWDGSEMRWLRLESETKFETKVKDDGEVRMRFEEKVYFREARATYNERGEEMMKIDKTTKQNRSWIPDLLKIAGLFYLIKIILGIIEFIPRPDITWIWIFIPVFWVQETERSEIQSDAEPAM